MVWMSGGYDFPKSNCGKLEVNQSLSLTDILETRFTFFRESKINAYSQIHKRPEIRDNIHTSYIRAFTFLAIKNI